VKGARNLPARFNRMPLSNLPATGLLLLSGKLGRKSTGAARRRARAVADVQRRKREAIRCGH
jgi:hypothetical protein